LRCFYTHHKKLFQSTTLWVPYWEFFGTGQKCHASSTLNKLMRERGGEKQSSGLKVLSGNCHRSGWRLDGGGLRGRAYTVQPIRKELIGMSQLAHCHWNLDSPEAAPAWPVAMAAQPAKQEEPGRRCPCFLWKISQLCVS
jgi:hypothetical protein